jgi:hypothetical protein
VIEECKAQFVILKILDLKTIVICSVYGARNCRERATLGGFF